jgi:hypothetical protein
MVRHKLNLHEFVWTRCKVLDLGERLLQPQTPLPFTSVLSKTMWTEHSLTIQLLVFFRYGNIQWTKMRRQTYNTTLVNKQLGAQARHSYSLGMTSKQNFPQ